MPGGVGLWLQSDQIQSRVEAVEKTSSHREFLHILFKINA